MKTKLVLILFAAVLIGVAGCSQENPIAPLSALSTVSVGSVNGVPGQYCTDLFAGQDIEAGTVCVEVIDNGDTEELCLTYTTTGGWELVETHFWLGEDLEDMPQTNKGSPKVGNFPYHSGDITGQTEYTVCVDLNQFGTEGGADDLCGMLLYAAAHAVVRKDNGDGTYQTETAWGDGGRMVEKGNWATYFTIGLSCEVGGGGPETGETAFAYDCWDANCFIDIDEDGEPGGDFNRWGWSNGPLGAGTYYLDIYAGAGQCDLSKGVLVGLLTVDYDGSTATVTYNTCGTYYMDEVHLYVGDEILPRDVNGDFTVAPGQYPYTDDDVATNSYTFTIDGLSGDIYVVAHAVVVGDYSQGDCGERGCVPPCVPGIYLSDGGGSYSALYSVALSGTQAQLTELYDFTGTNFNYVNHIGATPDGQTIYLLDENHEGQTDGGYLGAYDVETGDFADLGHLANYPGGVVQVAVSPDGVIFVASKVNGNLYTVDLVDLELDLVGNTGITIQGADMTFTPNGTLYLYTNWDDGLYTVHTGSGSATRVQTVLAGSITGLATVPGTSDLLFSDTNANTIFQLGGSTYSIYKGASAFDHTWGDMTSTVCGP
jgi:hypothetical protein